MAKIIDLFGKVLWSDEAATVKESLVAAAYSRAYLRGADLRGAYLSGAYLSGANLSGAYLRGADLRGAYLRGAYLSGANLSGAYLSGANLSGANLSGVDLRGVDLRGANLSGAYLSGAYLRGANLSRANLSGAYLRGVDLRGANLSWVDLSGVDLSGANLSGADLSGADGINKYLTSPLYMLKDQPGPIRAYKLVTADGYGPFNGGLLYEIGGVASADADCDEGEQCSDGINLATLDWCLREWKPGYRVLLCEFMAADIAAIPIGSDGKFRVHRCKIVSEYDLSAIGWPPAEKAPDAD